MSEKKWQYEEGLGLLTRVTTSGEEVTKVTIGDLTEGDLISAVTKSGNNYLFEIVDPKNNIARVYIAASRDVVSNGDQGKQQVDETFEVGKQIYYARRMSRTSAIRKLFLLKAKSQ